MLIPQFTDKMAEENIEEKFLLDLIHFYKKTLGDAASSVNMLKEIQLKFKDQYKDLVDLQEDPSILIGMSEKMAPEASKILIELMVKASTLSKRMNQLFESSLEEKEKLSKDIETFSVSMENNLKLLKEKIEKISDPKR